VDAKGRLSTQLRANGGTTLGNNGDIVMCGISI